MSVLTTSPVEIKKAIAKADVDLPDLGPGDWRSKNRVSLHLIEIVDGHEVLFALGHVSFSEMIDAVAEFEKAMYEEDQRVDYDTEDIGSIAAALNRLSYRRVKITDNEVGFDVDWFSGLTPITVWQLPHVVA